MAKETTTPIAKALKTTKNIIDKKIEEIPIQDILSSSIKIPGVKIDRAKFLAKELSPLFPKETVRKAIKSNPAQAGIPREAINTTAKQVINYETNKVSAVSFVAGIPGGLAMTATIPADIAQYFGFMLRVLQKLAYLYGFPEFEFNEDEITDSTMNQMLIFLGVMFGVQGANVAVKKVADVFSQKVARSLAQKALTKGTIYPIVKKIVTQLGFKMTKQIFANGIAKIVPVIGGVVTGGLTYATFKPSCKKLMNSFRELPISDPAYYADATDISKGKVVDIETSESNITSFLSPR